MPHDFYGESTMMLYSDIGIITLLELIYKHPLLIFLYKREDIAP